MAQTTEQKVNTTMDQSAFSFSAASCREIELGSIQTFATHLVAGLCYKA